jgi:hypothetical protein
MPLDAPVTITTLSFAGLAKTNVFASSSSSSVFTMRLAV